MTSQKETLTREQQDNVVRWIARGFEVQEVEFLQLSQNTSTRIYLLSVRINGDESLETTIPADSLDEFSNLHGVAGLNPRNHFQELERLKWLTEESDVDISDIKVVYLEN
ncbi:hypothetical protein EI998_09170 [Streptococcus suis]|uniref:Uncharacterized protein n=1 Tax=Streptococcus suis TaxID=1307 RepID=A0A426TAY8_STRSU|nr:hypothetical protein [Streptococcus suis]NQP64973.1 hypothetical protein [Streptococcus suis]RRR51200.1 hypothetical protein EI998_09170 [Streptococcus suis]HEL2576004.1 hypothetical protein [Streptococcus suis]